jgi:hypothetical protein
MIVLADRGSEQKIIEEERQEWLTKVLLAMGVPAKALELNSFDIKNYLTSMEVEVWRNADGSLDVYKNDQTVAQWKIPKLVLIKETPKKWYYEIHLNAWALPLQNLEE